MTFDQWDAMPPSEQRHRTLMHLAEVEAQLEAMERSVPFTESG